MVACGKIDLWVSDIPGQPILLKGESKISLTTQRKPSGAGRDSLTAPVGSTILAVKLRLTGIRSYPRAVCSLEQAVGQQGETLDVPQTGSWQRISQVIFCKHWNLMTTVGKEARNLHMKNSGHIEVDGKTSTFTFHIFLIHCFHRVSVKVKEGRIWLILVKAVNNIINQLLDFKIHFCSHNQHVFSGQNMVMIQQL